MPQSPRCEPSGGAARGSRRRLSVSFLLWGWGVAQYPYLIPFTHTIGDSAAPPITLELLLACLALGAVMLIPSLGYLFRTFSSAKPPP